MAARRTPTAKADPATDVAVSVAVEPPPYVEGPEAEVPAGPTPAAENPSPGPEPVRRFGKGSVPYLIDGVRVTRTEWLAHRAKQSRIANLASLDETIANELAAIAAETESTPNTTPAGKATSKEKN